MSTLSITVSLLALIISALTAWITLFRRGTIKMTQPTVIFFGPDGIGGSPKIFLRTLLFSTGKRGHVIENMYVKLYRAESVQNFNIWVYGEKTLVRGSGLYVGEEGVAHNHHFLLPKDGTNYEFLSGQFNLEVYAKLVNKSNHILLGKHQLLLTQEQAKLIKEKDAGIYYDWGPDQRCYQSHLEYHPVKETMEQAGKTIEAQQDNKSDW